LQRATLRYGASHQLPANLPHSSQCHRRHHHAAEEERDGPEGDEREERILSNEASCSFAAHGAKVEPAPSGCSVHPGKRSHASPVPLARRPLRLALLLAFLLLAVVAHRCGSNHGRRRHLGKRASRGGAVEPGRAAEEPGHSGPGWRLPLPGNPSAGQAHRAFRRRGRRHSLITSDAMARFRRRRR